MTFPRAALTLLLVGMAPGFGHVGHGQGSSAVELARLIQQAYDRARDFSADFVQVYQSGVIKKQTTERGGLLIKKPGKMRWEYTAPERKLFVSDGVKTYFYVPEDRQVIVSTVPGDDQATTPELFLAGKGSLARDFSVSLADAPAMLPQGTVALKLVPKRTQADYDWLVLCVEPGTYRLRGLVTADAQGATSTFSFTNLKENVGVPDKSFDFKPPRGVEIVTDSPRP